MRGKKTNKPPSSGVEELERKVVLESRTNRGMSNRDGLNVGQTVSDSHGA